MPHNPQNLDLIKETAECAVSHKNTKFSELLKYKHMILNTVYPYLILRYLDCESFLRKIH
jgi:hypothetical protein